MNRKFVGGCCGVIAVIFVMIAVFAVVAGPRAFQKGKKWFQGQMAEASRLAAIENAWQPPSAAPDASWFPETVGTWTLSTQEEIAGVPELQLDRAGRRAKYRGEKQDTEVIVVAANDLEKEAIFQRAKAALESGGSRVSTGGSGNLSYRVESHGSHVTTQTPGRLYVRTNGDEHTRLWWVKGWLFIFRTRGTDDPDSFAEKYLEAMTPRELEAR